MTAIDSRYFIGCDCCGFLCSERKKGAAIRQVIQHLDKHSTREEINISVWDSMGKGGGRVVHMGWIGNGVKSHGTSNYMKRCESRPKS